MVRSNSHAHVPTAAPIGGYAREISSQGSHRRYAAQQRSRVDSSAASALVSIEWSERRGELVAVGAAPFREMPSPAEMLQGIRRLMPDAARHVPDQHVVSQVALNQFAEPYGKKGQVLLAALNREHPASKVTTGGPGKFGKVPGFVRFASGSAEELWQRTETRLHDVIEAVKRDGKCLTRRMTR
jgi:hypothetical protein